MKTQIIFTLLFGTLITCSCVSRHTETEISETVLKSEITDSNFIQPPPPAAQHFSKLFTLNACFAAICQKENPKPTDTLYYLGLYKMDNHYVVFFIDAGAYKKNADEWLTKKGSDYKDKYYAIADSEFPDKTWKVVVVSIRNSLSAFTKTEPFTKSALAKCKALTVRFDDAVYLKIK